MNVFFFPVYPSTVQKYVLQSATPLCAGERVNEVYFVCWHGIRARIGFAKRHPPPTFARLAGMLNLYVVAISPFGPSA